jgi:hypothetical protein
MMSGDAPKHQNDSTAASLSFPDVAVSERRITISRGLWENLHLCRESLRVVAPKSLILLENMIGSAHEALQQSDMQQLNPLRFSKTAETVSKILRAIDLLDFILSPDRDFKQGPGLVSESIQFPFSLLRDLCEDNSVNDAGSSSALSNNENIDGSLGTLYRRHRDEIGALAS